MLYYIQRNIVLHDNLVVPVQTPPNTMPDPGPQVGQASTVETLLPTTWQHAQGSTRHNTFPGEFRAPNDLQPTSPKVHDLQPTSPKLHVLQPTPPYDLKDFGKNVFSNPGNFQNTSASKQTFSQINT